MGQGFVGAVHLVGPAGMLSASDEGPVAVLTDGDVGALPDGIDLAVVSVSAAAVAAIVDECGQKHMGGAVVMTAGFSDAGPGGVALERDVVAAARRHGMRLVGPASMGLLNTDPDVRLHAMARRRIAAGRDHRDAVGVRHAGRRHPGTRPNASVWGCRPSWPRATLRT